MSAADSPASLVALRQRRERAIQHLSDSFVADLLGVEQFEDRLSRAHAATTLAQLETLLADLAPLPPGMNSAALAPLSVDTALAIASKHKPAILAIFGNVERGGKWVVPGQLHINITFGNVELDFTDAQFAAPVTELTVRVVFGNLELTVPPQLAVDCQGFSVLGNIENNGRGAVSDPDRPLLRVRGVVVLGNIEVHTRLPSRR